MGQLRLFTLLLLGLLSFSVSLDASNPRDVTDSHDASTPRDVTNSHDVITPRDVMARLDSLERVVRQQDDRIVRQEEQMATQADLIRKQQEDVLRLQTTLKQQDDKLVAQSSRVAQQEETIGKQKSQLLALRHLVTLCVQRQVQDGVDNELLNYQGQLMKEAVSNDELSQIFNESSQQQDSVNSSVNSYLRPQHVSARSDDPDPLETVVAHLSKQVEQMDAYIQTLTTQNSLQDLHLQDARSSTFVHWGSSSCSDPTQLVYAGSVGGSLFSDTGAATNFVCLTPNPVLHAHASTPDMALLYGGEYQATQVSSYDRDPVCAVCRTPFTSTIMVPGTNACSPGWHLQYSGYLMAGRHDQAAASEFICVDGRLESAAHSEANQDGKLLFLTATRCGSLPCSPYVDNMIVLCAVCSK